MTVGADTTVALRVSANHLEYQDPDRYRVAFRRCRRIVCASACCCDRCCSNGSRCENDTGREESCCQETRCENGAQGPRQEEDCRRDTSLKPGMLLAAEGG